MYPVSQKCGLTHQLWKQYCMRGCKFTVFSFLRNLSMNELQQPRLLDRVRQCIRLKHMSMKTEEPYMYYIQ